MNPNSILYRKAKGNKQNIYLMDDTEPVVVSTTIHAIAEKHIPLGFIRCQEAFVVNSIFIKEIIGNEIPLVNGKVIYIAKRKIAEVKKTYMHLLAC